jgi:hypothetical protein
MLRESIQWFSKLTRWERLTLASWGLLLAIVCIRAAFWPFAHSVFPIFALASQKWLAAETLYARTNLDVVFSSTGLDVYRYSPIVAVSFVSLGYLPLGLGGVIWRLLGCGVYVFALLWWGRSLMRSNPASKNDENADRNWLAIFLLLVLPLSLDNLNNGQSNVLMIGLVMVSVLACGASRWNLAAVCAAAACLLKVYPLASAMLLAVVYSRRFTLRFLLALAIGILLPFALQRPDYVVEQYRTWIEHLRTDNRQGLHVELWYRDLRLLADLCGMPLSALTYALIQLTAGAAIALLCLAARRRRWPHHRLAPLLFGLACCWMTAFGVAAETSTYMIMAPIAAWCVVDAWRQHRPTLERIIYLAIYLLFGLARAAGSEPRTRFISMVAQPTVALILFALIYGGALWQLRRHPAGESETSLCPARAA